MERQKKSMKFFNVIAKRYDLLNRVISFGFDQSWRKKAVRIALENDPKRVLDIATGTWGFQVDVYQLFPKVAGIFEGKKHVRL